jgi:hypothetical protein
MRLHVLEPAEAAGYSEGAGLSCAALAAALKGVPADIQIADLHELRSLLDQAEKPRA